MTSVAQASFGSSGASRRITSSAVRIGASGLRSSCESIARNSSLRRFDVCSCASTSRRSSISICRLRYSRAFSSAIAERSASSTMPARSAPSLGRRRDRTDDAIRAVDSGRTTNGDVAPAGARTSAAPDR